MSFGSGVTLNNNNDTEKQCSQGRQDRTAYSSPRLSEFGPVGALTQTGTMPAIEMQPPMGPMGGINRMP